VAPSRSEAPSAPAAPCQSSAAGLVQPILGARRLTPIRPSVAIGTRKHRRLPCWGRGSKRADLLRFRLSFHFFWFQASSLHQTPIGDLVRSVVATPCPRNTSVPSLVQSKSSRLFVQLAPGSRKGQSSQEKRPSALHECSEGRWGSNQGLRMPGVFHEAIA